MSYSNISCDISIPYYFLVHFHRFNDLLPLDMPEQLDHLLEEFTEYQLLAESDIPQTTWQKAAVQEK
jgi:hypothetical protein